MRTFSPRERRLIRTTSLTCGWTSLTCNTSRWESLPHATLMVSGKLFRMSSGETKKVPPQRSASPWSWIFTTRLIIFGGCRPTHLLMMQHWWPRRCASATCHGVPTLKICLPKQITGLKGGSNRKDYGTNQLCNARNGRAMQAPRRTAYVHDRLVLSRDGILPSPNTETHCVSPIPETTRVPKMRRYI